MMKGLTWTTFVLGLWLVLAPFALMYSGTTAALWEDIIVGLLIAIFAFWHAYGAETQDMKGVSWAIVALGVWSILGPLAWGYSGVALWNDVVVGLVVAVLGTALALEKPSRKQVRMAKQHHGAY